MWQYQRTNELYHHGVLGMKWGVRRYQNKDGSLTPAGKKRADKLLKEYSKVTGKKVVVKKTTTQTNNRKKTVKEMTNEELDTLIRRKEKENRYKQLYPEQVSKGKKFMNSLKNDVIIPGAIGGARNGVQNIVSEIISNLGKDMIKRANKSNN